MKDTPIKMYLSGSEIARTIARLYVAGWTGRKADAVQHHSDQLAEIGVAPSSEVPLYYRVSSSLLVHANTIEVLGPETSGEVEPLIIQSAGALWLGLKKSWTQLKRHPKPFKLQPERCMHALCRLLLMRWRDWVGIMIW